MDPNLSIPYQPGIIEEYYGFAITFCRCTDFRCADFRFQMCGFQINRYGQNELDNTTGPLQRGYPFSFVFSSLLRIISGIFAPLSFHLYSSSPLKTIQKYNQ
jgi:hypothetical protein